MLAILAILCGISGIIYYIRIKKARHVDQQQETVVITQSTEIEQPVNDQGGRESTLYEDIKDEMDQPVAINENKTYAPNAANPNLGTESPYYVNTSFSQE